MRENNSSSNWLNKKRMQPNFWAEIRERFKLPWKHSAFRAYFIWIFILFGGLGIAIAIYEECVKCNPSYSNISKTIATTFIAVIAASLADLNLSLSFRNIPTLVINSIGFIALSILLLVLTYRLNNSWALVPAIIGYFISVFIWILANADNDKLNDETYYKRMMDNAKKLSQNWDDL